LVFETGFLAANVSAGLAGTVADALGVCAWLKKDAANKQKIRVKSFFIGLIAFSKV
jgi:hypothetical protein